MRWEALVLKKGKRLWFIAIWMQHASTADCWEDLDWQAGSLLFAFDEAEMDLHITCQ